MDLIADILLVAGALGAGLYCYVLARRLAKFNDLEAGVGGAVAVLSAQVDDMTRTLKAAQQTAGKSTERLETLTERAEGVSKRLELMLASMHDLQDASAVQDAKTEAEAAEEVLKKELEAAAMRRAEKADAETEAEEIDAEPQPEEDEITDEDLLDQAFEAEVDAEEEERLRRREKKKAKRKAKRKAAKEKEAATQTKKKGKSGKSTPNEGAKAAPVFTRHVA